MTPVSPRNRPRRIALIAHDNEKPILLKWAKKYRDRLKNFDLVATGTTGSLIKKKLNLEVHCFKSGPHGGDLQIGAMVAQGEIDFLIFFWDPLSPHPHDVDVRALLRIAVVYDIPLACNKASADLMIQKLI